MPDKVENPQPYPAGDGRRQPHKNNYIKCLLYLIVFLVFHAVIILVFALVITKVRTPKFHVRTVTFRNVTQQSNGSFTAVATAELSLRNANFGRYRYRSTTVAFFYKGMQVGAAEVAASSVGWQSTKKLEATAADWKLGVAAEDLPAGYLPAGALHVTSRAVLVGRVEVIFVMKKKRSAEMECGMDVVAALPEVRNVVCR
ncbi:uncharacterized protein LOC127259866 [Andrographis paniculata]|uniref:uncharacterized protein LOC127259866 n=1 Tax=Andrographis paniculata TaxID=175694 RepID=UPI0021E703C4|nr:uncharacterized protein LOC127259866 [Andrographis paniculata]